MLNPKWFVLAYFVSLLMVIAVSYMLVRETYERGQYEGAYHSAMSFIDNHRVWRRVGGP